MVHNIIDILRNLPPESILCMEYFLCIAVIICAIRFLGKSGIFAYIGIAVIIANIQVLKTAHFQFLEFPVALGTIVFSSTFIITDILTEFYGTVEARKGVWVGFGATLFTSLIMMFTLGIAPMDETMEVHLAIERIFTPLPSLFFASIISYLVCQYLDIWVFQSVKNITKGKYLGLRTIVASSISAIFDNIIFSTLAFYVFAENPVGLHELVYTYILGTYIFRLITIILQAPLIYVVKSMIN